MTLKLSGTFTAEELLDVLAYLLATNANTQNVQWIVGDVGMGSPSQTPFGYVQQFSETVKWYTANGGQGGLSAGGAVEDWAGVVLLTVAFQPHQFVDPIPAQPPANSPVSPIQLGTTPPYFEQPGWRLAQQLTESVKAALRENITVAGVAATMKVADVRPVLLTLNGVSYRAIRFTAQTQQRRPRGD